MYYHFEIQIEKEEIIENGMVDKKGRKIGLKIITGIMIATEGGSHDVDEVDKPGKYFGVRMQATRDGEEFNSYQRMRYYKSQDERQKKIDERVKKLMK